MIFNDSGRFDLLSLEAKREFCELPSLNYFLNFNSAMIARYLSISLLYR